MNIVSLTIYIVCINFIHKSRDLQFKVDPERQTFWETFHRNFVWSWSICQKSAEKKSPKKYYFFSYCYENENSVPSFNIKNDKQKLHQQLHKYNELVT